ncbi:orotate phosphoribosyltransferase, partial [Thermococci archaeon]
AKEALEKEGYTLIPLVTVGDLFKYREKRE